VGELGRMSYDCLQYPVHSIGFHLLFFFQRKQTMVFPQSPRRRLKLNSRFNNLIPLYDDDGNEEEYYRTEMISFNRLHKTAKSDKSAARTCDINRCFSSGDEVKRTRTSDITRCYSSVDKVKRARTCDITRCSSSGDKVKRKSPNRKKSQHQQGPSTQIVTFGSCKHLLERQNKHDADNSASVLNVTKWDDDSDSLTVPMNNRSKSCWFDSPEQQQQQCQYDKKQRRRHDDQHRVISSQRQHHSHKKQQSDANDFTMWLMVVCFIVVLFGSGAPDAFACAVLECPVTSDVHPNATLIPKTRSFVTRAAAMRRRHLLAGRRRRSGWTR
jgi:hypothetical protein